MTLPNVDPGLRPDERWCPRCGEAVVPFGLICEHCEAVLTEDEVDIRYDKTTRAIEDTAFQSPDNWTGWTDF